MSKRLTRSVDLTVQGEEAGKQQNDDGAVVRDAPLSHLTGAVPRLRQNTRDNAPLEHATLTTTRWRTTSKWPTFTKWPAVTTAPYLRYSLTKHITTEFCHLF